MRNYNQPKSDIEVHENFDTLSHEIHQGHQGIAKCRERAKQAAWCPGLSRQIEDMVSSCRVCATHKINKPEPLCPTVFPERPWQVS